MQRRLVEGGSNYLSQDPAEVHFGIGDATHIDRLDILWPDGESSSVGPIVAGSRIVVRHIEAPPPACNTAAPTNPCSPGGITRADCLVETRLAGAVVDRRARMPGAMVVCHEGDTRCDVDPDPTNGECHFPVTICLDNRDPRRRPCELGTAALTLDEPSAAADDSTDRLNRTALLAALADFGLPPIGDVLPVFSNGRPDLCSPPATLRVRLRSGPTGLRRAYRRLVLRAAAGDGTVDRDVVRLVCLPAQSPP
jgi:hypothetical protein